MSPENIIGYECAGCGKLSLQHAICPNCRKPFCETCGPLHAGECNLPADTPLGAGPSGQAENLPADDAKLAAKLAGLAKFAQEVSEGNLPAPTGKELAAKQLLMQKLAAEIGYMNIPPEFRRLCDIHHTKLTCPRCFAATGGSVKNKDRAKASRLNGKLGGRPKKKLAKRKLAG